MPEPIPMPEMRLVVHLGMPKTGTSLLQNVIVRLLRRTPDLPLIYPEYGRGKAIAHHRLTHDLRDGDPAALGAALVAEIAERRAEAPNARVAFCSSEGFTNLCGSSVADRLVAFFDAMDAARGAGARPAEAVLVVRELSTFLQSMYLQSARFGHTGMAFPDYLRSRRKWVRELFAGLVFLQDRLGPRVVLEFQKPGFDVLAYFARHLGLAPDPLAEIAAEVPSTATRTLKEQIALTHLPHLEAALGLPIDRQRLVALFEGGFAFADDLRGFTLYAPDAQGALADEIAADAVAAGFDGYARAFAGFRPKAAPEGALAFERLSAADRAALAAVKDRIAPRSSGAAAAP